MFIPIIELSFSSKNNITFKITDTNKILWSYFTSEITVLLLLLLYRQLYKVFLVGREI